jgi:hypothetical protein
MKKKTKGGIVYNFDIATIGRISVEREYNRNLYLDEEGAKLITELNAFAHSFDFQSDMSVFKTPNAYRFLLTDKQDKIDYTDYFINNLKKTVCNNEEFITLLVDIYSDETIDLTYESIDTESFVILSNYMKKLTDFILFDDFSGVKGKKVIKSGINETKEFLMNIKFIYGENYIKSLKGGVGSGEYPLLYSNKSDYTQVVGFQSYSNIKEFYSNNDIKEDFLDELTIIIGFANVFRFCGLFGIRTNVYKFLNKLYHLLRYYPINGSIEEKNNFVKDIYIKAHFVLLEIVKKIYFTCVGSNLNKTEVKSRSSSLSKSVKEPDPEPETHLRRSSRTASKK